MNQEVILVNESDEQVGIAEKMEAHERGMLHRAFSIFIFNKHGDLLLQQRALKKYHSGGLWTNTCCSHPNPGENTQDAANRRLMEEMGFQTSLQKVFDFVYKAEVENGLTEYEFDHVYVGEYEGTIRVSDQEVMGFAYKPLIEIEIELKAKPELYTTWFRIAFPRILTWWQHTYKNKVA